MRLAEFARIVPHHLSDAIFYHASSGNITIRGFRDTFALATETFFGTKS
jgi:hypothetical protein